MDAIQTGPQDPAKAVSKCTAKVRLVHDPVAVEETDPDTGIRFMRTTCASCLRWIKDEPLPA